MLVRITFQKFASFQIFKLGMIIFLTCGIHVTDVGAQDSKNDRRIGNGRFFKNLREQFSQSENDNSKKEDHGSKNAGPNPQGNGQNQALNQNQNRNVASNRPTLSGARPNYPPQAGPANSQLSRSPQAEGNRFQRNTSPNANLSGQPNRISTVAQQRELQQRQLEYERARQAFLAAEQAYQQTAQRYNVTQPPPLQSLPQASRGVQSRNDPAQLQYSGSPLQDNRMQAVSARRRNENSTGFGMKLKTDKSDKILIDNMDRNGNADNAGLKKGDQVIAIGGVPIDTVEEFEEIAQILNDGDQMEVRVLRRGKEIDAVLAYGEPIDTENGFNQSATLGNSSNSSSNLPASNQRQRIGSGVAPDFVPRSDQYSLPSRSDAGSLRAAPQNTPLRRYEIPTPPSQRQQQHRSLHELELDLKSNLEAEQSNTNRTSRRPNSILEID